MLLSLLSVVGCNAANTLDTDIRHVGLSDIGFEHWTGGFKQKQRDNSGQRIRDEPLFDIDLWLSGVGKYITRNTQKLFTASMGRKSEAQSVA